MTRNQRSWDNILNEYTENFLPMLGLALSTNNGRGSSPQSSGRFTANLTQRSICEIEWRTIYRNFIRNWMVENSTVKPRYKDSLRDHDSHPYTKVILKDLYTWCSRDLILEVLEDISLNCTTQGFFGKENLLKHRDSKIYNFKTLQ